MIEKAIGQRIRDLRHQLGLNQDELAQRTGIHVSTLSAIESGKRNVSVLTLQTIADGLDVTISELLDI